MKILLNNNGAMCSSCMHPDVFLLIETVAGRFFKKFYYTVMNIIPLHVLIL